MNLCKFWIFVNLRHVFGVRLAERCVWTGTFSADSVLRTRQTFPFIGAFLLTVCAAFAGIGGFAGTVFAQENLPKTAPAEALQAEGTQTEAVQAEPVPAVKPVNPQEVYLSIRSRIAPSLVRLEMVGGSELVGKVRAIRESTGLLITPDGYLFASAAAFAHSPSAVVAVTADGQRFPAQIVSTDFGRKISLLKIEPRKKEDGTLENFQVPAAAKLENARTGQKVLAFGKVLSPQTPSFTTGILSGKNRMKGWAIQTDAHVSTNNYGGPLVNLDGEVLGILTPFGMGENGLMTGLEIYDSGVGFAIPLEDLLALLPRMKTEKELHPAPKLGLLFSNPSPNLAGTEVLYAAPNSPAAVAGIEAGDVVTHVDGEPVERASDFQKCIGRHFKGETVKLGIKRKGGFLEKELKLADLAKKGEF